MLVDSEGRVTEEIRALLREEILKLKVSQEGLRAQINNQPKDGLHETPQINNHLNVMNTTNLNHLEEELNEEIEETIQENFTEDPSVVADIISKLFEPCTKSLKEDKYCYTSGALIHKLGGLFIDPMSFEKNKIDLLTYLSLSGIKLKASLHKIDKYITSGMPNLFAKCFPDETHMIAPRKYWPRLVIISLIFEKIENDINLKKEMGLIPEEVAPVTHFVAWYRNLCYQQGVTGRQNVNSDHMYGAALDASFVEQSTLKTFAHYKNFIQKNIIDNDIFGIVHPLKSSNLTISVGLGHGKGAHGMGKLHLGIMSEIDGGDGIRTWTY